MQKNSTASNKNQLSGFLIPFLILSLLLIITSCANPIAPTGGPKDETPPGRMEEKSTPNFQTNFQPKTIEITFDEWIKIQNANEQVIISPPFDGYQVHLKGKTLIFDFGEKDTLRKDVTYVIQFGETVKDLTEGNPAEDLRFVFSTGPEIDSLEINGTIVDAYTADPVEKALVLLYENRADSVFRTERPFYFGKTNEFGQFNISNLRAGTYKVCALVDADANYKFSQVNEKIGFLDQAIVISADSTMHLDLKLFEEQLPLQLLETDSSVAGLMKLTFNQVAEAFLEINTSTDFLTSFEKDTTFIWHQSPDTWTLYLAADSLFHDTLKVPGIEENTLLNDLQLRPKQGQSRQVYPRSNFTISFSSPIIALDTSKIKMLADSSLSPQALSFEWSIDSLDNRNVPIKHSFKENTTYFWTALPGAITDIWNQNNTDTLVMEWRMGDRKKFGNIRFQFTSNNETDAYFVKLVLKGKETIMTYRLQGALLYEKKLTGIPPGDYQLEIIQDKNANDRWDTGSYEAGLQAEKVIIRPIEKLRANWDLDVKVDMGDIFNH